MRNVVLAVVGSQGKVSTSFASALNRTSEKAADKNIYIHFDSVAESTSGISTALQKNIMANRVLNSTIADGIFFINPNLSWVPEDFLKLANYDGNGILAGSYVESFDPMEQYAIELEDASDEKGDGDYPKAKTIPMGFVYIQKKVLQGLTQFVDILGEGEKDPFYLFFKEDIKEGLLLPEDAYFCDLVRSAGFTVRVDINVNCTNNSTMALRTDYQAYLSKAWIGKMGEDIPQN